MKKTIRLSMIGFSIALAVVSLAIIIFASTFDLNDYKDRISRAVLDETGRTLSFDGDLSLEFFPRLGVSLGGVRLSNASGFPDKDMVKANSAHVGVRILPLLTGKVKFGHLELDGLSLNLNRLKNGRSNWDDLVGRSSDEQNTTDTNEFSLDIDGVTIKDASLAWDDEVSDTMFVMRDVDLVTGRIYQGAPFPVQADLQFECSGPQIAGKLSLSGKSSIDFANREYGHMDMKLTLDAKGTAIPGGQVKGSAGFQFLAMNFNEEHAQLTGFSATAYGVTARVDGSLEGITQGIKKLVATINVEPFDARNTLEQIDVDHPVTADSTVFSKVSGMADVVYSKQNLNLKSFQLDVDDTRIIGNLQLKHRNGEPQIFARLDAGTLDLDRYLPPDQAEKIKESKKAVASGEKSIVVFDSKRLRQLHLDAEAKVARLRAEGAWLQNVHAKVKADRGMVHVSPLSAELYGGSLSSGLTVDATGKYPRTNLILGLNKVNVGLLSKDVSGKESYAGILDFNAALSGQGERMPVILRSLDGKVSFHLSDGVFPGVNLVSMAKKTHESKDKKVATVEAAATDSTKFGSINGTGLIQAGVLRNKDLEVKAPGLRADGHGAVVLPTRELDYMLKVKLVATGAGQGGKASDDLYGIMVPIRVSGTIDNPHYWVSITEYVKALGGAVIGTAGSLIGGAVNVIKGVGKAVIGVGGDKE